MQWPDLGPVQGLPTLKFVIPHGGGAVPYHWARFRGLAQEMKKPLLKDHLLNNVFFDTCVYHQPGIDPAGLRDSGRQHPVRERDDRRGARHRSRNRHYYDDTKRYIEALDIDAATRQQIYEGNARRVYPRLDAALTRKGI
ncbi:hypothetical protein [Burkholderia plantarii]|uniref:hypothetical protein n=1 Tax=Burkholderia plantarii TaxID=41899 RepID=UPI0018DBEB6C|nr:hypothetical protein [Burkholderia plantarii]MBI0329019.1 hypothetical protein [Burkholderia plantarii]